MRKVSLGRDNPVVDKKYPMGAAGFSCTSGDQSFFGMVYYTEGLGNPTVVLCHGFPGMEKNYDIAQFLRRAGFNAVIFSYRGAWGSHGAFKFSGVAEDTTNVVRMIQQRKLPEPDRFDSKRIVLAGHSMGGFAAFRAAAVLPEIEDLALLAVWNVGADAKRIQDNADDKQRVGDILSGAACLAGTNQAKLLNEMLQNAEGFDLRNEALAFKARHVLLIGAKEDKTTPIKLHQGPLASMLRREGALISEKSLTADHSFSAKRIGVTRILLQWLTERGY